MWRAAGRLCRSTPHFRGKWRYLSVAARRIRVRGYTTTIAFDRGQRIVLDLDDWIPYQLFLTGVYDVETHHTTFFRRVVQPGMVVLDVGAHIGYYTLQAAARVGPTGQVHSFEPSMRACTRLLENVSLNAFTNVTINRCIVHGQPGQMQLTLGDDQNTGTSTTLTTLANDSGRRELVDAIMLDDYVRSKELRRVDLVKIDAEGSDLAVLSGARELLSQQNPQLLIEISPPSSGPARIDVIDYLRGFGYLPWRIGARGPEPWTGPLVKREPLVLFRRPGAAH